MTSWRTISLFLVWLLLSGVDVVAQSLDKKNYQIDVFGWKGGGTFEIVQDGGRVILVSSLRDPLLRLTEELMLRQV